MNKKKIKQLLRDITQNSNISLPSSIDFKIEDGKLIICIAKEGICANMQTDKSAFESWALCLKAWLHSYFQEVLIWWDLDLPNKINDKEKWHYERFKYRVCKFIKTYKWASASFDCDSYYNDFREWVLNFPKTKPTEDIKQGEARLEKDYKEKHEKDYEGIDRQLPVGVFNGEVKQENSVMPARSSQIDIWAIKNNTLHVFELKTPENKKIGIISELMYYVNIMNDVKYHRITYPSDAAKITHRSFDKLYTAFKEGKIQHIEGHFLTQELHPLINNKVIDLMNNSDLLKKNSITYLHKIP